MQTGAQVLIFLFYTSACTMHRSIIRPDLIPAKTIIVLMILTLCLAYIYKLSKFHVIHANDSLAYQKYAKEITINTW